MNPEHTLCRSAAPYQIEVGGILTPTEIRRGSQVITVARTGHWRIGPPDGRPVLARFPHLLATAALYDAHVHLHPAVSLAAYVAYGVARVRDLGSSVLAVRTVPDCDIAMPEIVLGGPLLDCPGKPRLPFALAWNNATELPALIDAAAERGASWIKLYERFPAAAFETAVRHAHARGMRVTAHVAPGDHEAAIGAGVDELQHLACLVPNGDGTRGTHALLRRWAQRQPHDTWPQLPSGTAVCPTLLVQHQLVREATRCWAFPEHEPEIADLWRRLPVASRPWTDSELAAGRAATEQLSSVVSRLDEAGVRWVIGSDTPNPGLHPGRSLWEEMNLLIAAGLDTVTVYRSACVTRGLAESGAHALTFLPLSTFDSLLLPVQPPPATLLRGCLFKSNR